MSTGSPGGSGIRLAGATNSVHIMDVRSRKWEMVSPSGEAPSPRAAHAAAAVGTMVVIQVCFAAGIRRAKNMRYTANGTDQIYDNILQVHDLQ